MPLPATKKKKARTPNLGRPLDAVAGLSPAIADALCRLSAGLAIACPEPGPRDPIQRWLRRPVVLTLTREFELPATLASRALVVDLPPLAAEARLSESAMADLILERHPRMLAALCAALSRLLGQPLAETPAAHRHLDTLARACAAFPELADPFRDAVGHPAPPHPVVTATRHLLAENPRWTGTAEELVSKIRIGPNPRALSHYLRNAILDLADGGIDVSLSTRPAAAASSCCLRHKIPALLRNRCQIEHLRRLV